MTEIGTLDILAEIQSLVSDKLQVVSYKWLSRNFSVSSNEAKRILREFVEQNGSGLETLYILAGRVKNGAPYHIQLVSGGKLAEVKNQFEDDCSVQVYSVQACIPKDPAVLWNSEFVQNSELFDQPSCEDNCFKDNRFGAVKNSFVKRDSTGTAFLSKSKSSPQTPIIPDQKAKIGQVSAKSKPSPGVAASPVIKVEQPSAKSTPSPAVPSPVIKTESKISNISPQPHANVGKVAAAVPATKKKAQNGKSPSGAGGSLAKMFSKASVKPKPTSPAETKDKETPMPIENLATADAQICLREETETVSDDDDDMGFSNKRASNGEGKRKRQVIFDDSDEDDFESAVNLASPDPPKILTTPNPETLLEKNTLDFEDQNEEIPKIEKRVGKVPKLEPKVEKVIDTKDKASEKSPKSPDPVNNAHQKDKPTVNASSKPTRKKVLKTRIDERGREVTEVVWEGEEIENKDADKKKTVVTETSNNRMPTPPPPVVAATKKPPAVGNNAGNKPPVAKGGAKKAGKGAVKDAKQGNITSFFKKA